jgi:hypothetical protein
MTYVKVLYYWPIVGGNICLFLKELNMVLLLCFFNWILIEIPTKEFECLNLQYNIYFCNLIHGWINWAMFYNKVPNTSKIGAKKDFGF